MTDLISFLEELKKKKKEHLIKISTKFFKTRMFWVK